MFDLFRFVLLRPSVPAEAGSLVATDLDSHLQQQLKEDRREASPLEKLQKTADEFVAGGSFVSELDRLALADGFAALSAAIATQPPSNRQKLAAAIESAFGMGVADLVGDDAFAKDRMRLVDSLVAAKLASAPPAAPLPEIARYVRLQALIVRSGDDDPLLDEKGAIEMAAKGHILMPAGLLPLPDRAPQESEGRPDEREQEGRERKEQAEREYHSLKDAYRFLTELEGDDLVMDLEEARPERRPPSRERADDGIRQELRQLRETLDQRHGGGGPAGMLLDSGAAMHRASMRIRPQAYDRASDRVREAMQSADADPLQANVPAAAEAIRRRMEELFPLIAGDEEEAVAIVGGQAVRASAVGEDPA